MTDLRATWAVFRFERGRTLTLPRLAFAAALILFPVAMVSMVQYQGGHLERDGRAAVALFFLIPDVLCLMGLLLWATPVVHAELEGKTWTYLAVRPSGKGSIIVGKYLSAVAWTALCAWISLTICVALIQPDAEALRVWAFLAVLTGLSCLAYGALYVLLGVLFLRRAMVVAVAYTVLLEVLVAWVPAMISQLTVQYHLRSAGAQWILWKIKPLAGSPILLSTAPAWQHVLILLGFTTGFLAAAVLILRRRELVTADED